MQDSLVKMQHRIKFMQTIVALGAGAITKAVYPNGRIERCENVKDIKTYLEKTDEMIERKKRLFAD